MEWDLLWYGLEYDARYGYAPQLQAMDMYNYAPCAYGNDHQQVN